MNIKKIGLTHTCLGALALAMVSGTALAGALDSPDNMAPFFTDSGMKTMKPMAEFKAAFMAMPMEKQEAVKKECNDAAMSKPYAEFCANVQALGGAN